MKQMRQSWETKGLLYGNVSGARGTEAGCAMALVSPSGALMQVSRLAVVGSAVLKP